MTTAQNSTETTTATTTETLCFAVDGSELVARCGTFEARDASSSALLRKIWDAAGLEQPSEVAPEDDGCVRYDAELELGGVELCRAECWLLCGWLSRGASQDLDGSGLALWGDSQPGGWSVCESDGQEHGLAALGLAYEDALRAAAQALLDSLPEEDEARELADDLLSEIGRNRQQRVVRADVQPPRCPEPDASWVASQMVRDRALAKIGDAEIKAGLLLGHVVLVCEATNEFVVDPDEDDVEEIAEKIVTACAIRDGEWADRLSELADKLRDC